MKIKKMKSWKYTDRLEIAIILMLIMVLPGSEKSWSEILSRSSKSFRYYSTKSAVNEIYSRYGVINIMT